MPDPVLEPEPELLCVTVGVQGPVPVGLPEAVPDPEPDPVCVPESDPDPVTVEDFVAKAEPVRLGVGVPDGLELPDPVLLSVLLRVAAGVELPLRVRVEVPVKVAEGLAVLEDVPVELGVFRGLKDGEGCAVA